MNKFLIPVFLFLGMAGSAAACNTQYNITLQTFGEGVLVELRSGDELAIAKNAAFTLSDPDQRARFAREYRKSAALYYQGQPDFDELLARIGLHLDSM